MSEIEPTTIDIKGILALIPHRYPFMMVDRILSIDIDAKEITGLKNVSMNEPFFQGHFPENPVMPGVMMLEGLAQVGAVYGFCANSDFVGEKLAYFVGINKARFRKQVGPGDQLIYKLKLVKEKRNLMVMDAKGYVDGKVVVEAELMASFN
ncbi:MAG: 3-hydroxyacyl-ACP dehydratase FabZ [Desulfotalea sp.]